MLLLCPNAPRLDVVKVVIVKVVKLNFAMRFSAQYYNIKYLYYNIEPDFEFFFSTLTTLTMTTLTTPPPTHRGYSNTH